MEQINIKQGQSFIITGYFRENDRVTPKSLAGVTITSKLRDRTDAIIATLTVNIIDEPNGIYQLTAPEGTTLWPIGELYWDIFETVGGVTYPTETVIVKVERGQSR